MQRVVFVTGASRGIGRAVAERFVKEGWRVAGFYKNKSGDELAGCKYFKIDVEDWESVQKGFEEAYKWAGQIDALVNCAGIFGFRGLGGYDEKLMDEVINTNEKGTYWCTKWVMEKMTEGAIVNISSTAAQVGSTDPVYAASKAAILGFTKSMAKALAPTVRVNCVAPSMTNTDMMRADPGRIIKHKGETLLGRVAEPEDVADGIYFLVSDQARHITGACLDINGGYVLR